MPARSASFPTIAVALLLASCGGGGGDSGAPTSSGGSAGPSAASPGAFSSGAITAFGSVFVNGIEYSTAQATVVDDDTGATTASIAGLEVGQVADVDVTATSTAAAPAAGQLHIHPLARGSVDTIDSVDSTIVVMGQSVQVDASTSFSDHRACVSASVDACTAITGLSGLTATTGGAAGNYVSVDGYLFDAGGGATSGNIVATLVSVRDTPTGDYGAAYKAEGLVAAAASGSLTVGGLAITLSGATCYASGGRTDCATAFATGEVVSAFAAAAPTLPATSFAPDVVILRPSRLVSTAGATVDVEGSVSSVTTSPASFVIRGVTIDASALSSGSLPTVGDIVRVLGTVAATGSGITASSVTVLRHSRNTTYGFEGDITAVGTPAAGAFTVTVLGKTLTVTAASRLADESSGQWYTHDPSANPFNIVTFPTYVAASASQHVLAQTWLDTSGNLQVIAMTLVRASSVSAVSGLVDATPAPVDTTATGTPTTFDVAGVPVSADPAAISKLGHGVSGNSVSAGDEVTVFGTWAAGIGPLTVGPTRGRNNEVIDVGAPRSLGMTGF